MIKEERKKYYSEKAKNSEEFKIYCSSCNKYLNYIDIKEYLLGINNILEYISYFDNGKYCHCFCSKGLIELPNDKIKPILVNRLYNYYYDNNQNKMVDEILEVEI